MFKKEVTIKVNQRNPLVFDIIKNYRKESSTDLNNFDLILFESYLNNVLEYDEYYENTSNSFKLKKIDGKWIIFNN